MSEAKLAPAPPVKSSARSRFALLILLLIFAFIGYGIYERIRLHADLENEKKAVEAVRSLQGMTVESNSQDWRVVFVPDQPQLAKRVGGIYIPYEGKGPGYTNQVAEVLRALGMCEELNVSDGPVSGGMRMGPAPKRVLKPGEIPPEKLDLDALRKEFPRLKVLGDQLLAQQEKEADNQPTTEAEKPKEVAPVQ